MPVQAADQWTNLNGTSTVTADMLGLWNGRVLLRLENGRRVSVKLEDLRADSRLQAEARLEELQQRMRQRSDEIKLIAEEASAPAPKDSPTGSAASGVASPTAPRYVSVAEGADLRQNLVGIRDQILAGHLRVLFDTLPASHQKAFEDLFVIVLNKLDGETFDANRRTMQGVGELIISRQRWLFSHPRMALMSDSQQSQLLSMAAFLQALFADDVMSVEAMKGRTFGETLAKVDEIIAPYIYATINSPGSGLGLLQPDFEVAPAGENKMLAKLVLPVIGPVFSQTFVSTERRWAWGESANSLQQYFQDMAKTMEQAPDRSAGLPFSLQTEIAKVDQAVNVLMQAKNREDFHRALDGVLPVIAEVVNQWSGYKPPAMQGLAGAAGSYPSDASYEEMMSASGGETPAGMGPGIPGLVPGGVPSSGPAGITGPATPELGSPAVIVSP